jgi:hypothetical protein
MKRQFQASSWDTTISQWQVRLVSALARCQQCQHGVSLHMSPTTIAVHFPQKKLLSSVGKQKELQLMLQHRQAPHAGQVNANTSIPIISCSCLLTHQASSYLELQGLSAILPAGVKHAAVIKRARVVHRHKVTSLAAAGAAAAVTIWARRVLSAQKGMLLSWLCDKTACPSTTGTTAAATAV